MTARLRPFSSLTALLGPSVTLVVLLLPGSSLVGAPNGGATALGSPGATGGCSLVNYSSSVDSFPLSYYECLPPGFNNATSYPLIVYLHGIDETESSPLPGGYLDTVNDSWAATAAARGYILLFLNTRTGVGFYVNSLYTGPQEQDVWDAIHSVESRHSVSSLYLFGTSMGGSGAYLLAGHHPGEVAGIGAVVAFPDYFEEYAYQLSIRNPSPTANFMANVSGGLVPTASAYALRLWSYLSVGRMDPGNFSGIRIYAVGGGNDVAVPNNPAFWPFEQADNTFVNRSCLVAQSVGEPAGCTDPFNALSATHPGTFVDRYVYEPAGIHADADVNFSDMLDFWEGRVASGIFWSTIGGTPTPPPTPVVEFATIPSTCGSVVLDGQPFPYGNASSLLPGAYSLGASPCPGYELRSLTAVGNATYFATNGTLDLLGDAVLVANFTEIPPPPRWTVVFTVSPAGCGPLALNGSSYSNGSSASFLPGTYAVLAGTCNGWLFETWNVSGGVAVDAPSRSSAYVTVTANGTLAARYSVVQVPPPPTYPVGVSVEPASCGAAVELGGETYGNGSTATLAGGDYALDAAPCAGFHFENWTVAGQLVVTPGNLTVLGPGNLTLRYLANESVPVAPASFPWALVGVGVAAGVVAVGAALLVHFRGRRGG